MKRRRHEGLKFDKVSEGIPPMGRYSGVKEMIEMSKTPGEYKYH